MSLQDQTEDEETEGAIDAPARVAVPVPLPLYTIVLIVGIAVVAVTQITTGLDASIQSAGFVKAAFLRQHQYWRILTGATTHLGILHFLLNCYAFFSFGRIFEMLVNRAHLAIVFLLSAIGGGVLSLIFMPNIDSVGASGGIVGLIGYLLIYAFRRRQFISSAFRKNLLINIGLIVVIGIVFFGAIDNFGHLGGFITGAAYGLLQIPSDEHIDPRVAGSTVEFAGIAAVGIYLAACLLSVLLIIRAI